MIKSHLKEKIRMKLKAASFKNINKIKKAIMIINNRFRVTMLLEFL